MQLLMSPTDQIAALRLLRYARTGEPTTVTPERRRVLGELVLRGLVTVEGTRRAGTLLKITKSGLEELRALELANPGVTDYAVKTAVRRSRER